MYTIKWETLKEKAIIECRTRGHNLDYSHTTYALVASMGGSWDWRAELKKMQDAVIDRIKQWDIRTAKKLIGLFPTIVTKKYRNITPIAEYNENGDWVLTFSE